MAKKNQKSRKSKDDEVELEDRFAAAETRPQFRSLKKDQNKVVLDERFASVLTDSRFQLEGKDKYGRKKKKQAAKEELSAFYTIEDKKEKEAEDGTDDESSQSSEEPVEKETEKNKDSDSDSDDGDEDPASRIAYLTALSRGELNMSSSSEDDDSSQSSDEDEDEEDGEDPVHGTAGILDPSNKDEDEVEISYEDSPFLVATQLDWENIRAVDIFAILSSFVPPGAVKKVDVYQSDFGMERMAKDRLQGPSDLWKKKKVSRPVESDDDSEESTAGAEERPEDDTAEDSEDDDDSSKDSEDEDDEIEARVGINSKMETVIDESDFDPEKLRAYEASKLKYFFAVVEFAQPQHSDIAYREVDGMEFEHSSSAIDLRTLPAEAVDDVIKNRPKRDSATAVPSNYDPPEFIVSALQQTNVQCTWDQGDVERERKLTRYHNGGWSNMTDEAKDLQVYLASDASSDDDSEDEKVDKGSKMRKLLGLDSGDEDDGSGASADASDSGSDDEDGGMTMKFIPGSKSLEEKIRNKLGTKDEEEKELTPWEKYQEKRKQKRRERRQATRNKRSGKGETPAESDKDDSDEASENDDFFLDDTNKSNKSKKQKVPANKKKGNKKSSDQELELLLAGEHAEEEARDYDIRGIQRMEKNKGKKLKGGRKRKEDKIAADVAGKDFKINVDDDRFAAVLDGSDDRFGIDKTDPNFKDTSAMREILTEQSKRRKKKRRRTQEKAVPAAPNVNVESNASSAGASALSMLVKKLKTQVSSTNQ